MTGVNRIWRIARTLLALGIFGLGIVLTTLVLTPVLTLLPCSKIIKRRWTRRIISRLSWLYLRLLRTFRLIDVQLGSLAGLERPGQLIVANHPTLMDAIFLMSLLPHASFVVKAAMAKNPFTACLVSLAGYLPNSYEGPELIARAVQTLDEGQSLVIFPEGTRTATEQLSFQRGAANIALQADCTIQPVLIDCQPRVLRKHEKWYQVPPCTPLFSLRTLAALDVHQCIDPHQPTSLQARELTRLLQNKFSCELQLPS